MAGGPVLRQVVPGQQMWQATLAAGQRGFKCCLWFLTGIVRWFVIHADVCCEPGMAGVPVLGRVVPGQQVWQATFAAGQMCLDSCLWFPTGRSRQFVIQTDVCCEPGMAGVPVLGRVVPGQQVWQATVAAGHTGPGSYQWFG